MDIYTIVEYVMHTPYNTNRAILEDMLYEYTEEIYSGGGEIEEITVLNKQTDGETIFYRIDDTTLSPSNIFILDGGYLLQMPPKGRYFISSGGEIYNWEFNSVESAFLMTPLSSSQEKKYIATVYTRQEIATNVVDATNNIYKNNTGLKVSSLRNNVEILTNIDFMIRDNSTIRSDIQAIGVVNSSSDDIDISDAFLPSEFYSNFNNKTINENGYLILFFVTGEPVQVGSSLYTYYYGVKKSNGDIG